MKGSNPAKKRGLGIRGRETLVSYIFLLPALIFFVLFVIGPILTGLYTSFFNYTARHMDFIGFGNYKELLQSDPFLKSLRNTVLLVIGTVPIVVIFSLFVSSVLNKTKAVTSSLFRGIFYMPVVTGTVAIVVVWKWIFDPLNGILNWGLKTTGVIDKNIMWTGDKRFALIAILIVLFTTSVGQPIILYVSALGNVDASNIEAAQIDGATNSQIFRHIKWPSIMPTTLYVVVITTINSFQCFSLVQLLTGGGPNYNSSTIMYLVYEYAFKQQRFGYANAMGVILAIIIGAISLVQFRSLGSKVEY